MTDEQPSGAFWEFRAIEAEKVLERTLKDLEWHREHTRKLNTQMVDAETRAKDRLGELQTMKAERDDLTRRLADCEKALEGSQRVLRTQHAVNENTLERLADAEERVSHWKDVAVEKQQRLAESHAASCNRIDGLKAKLADAEQRAEKAERELGELAKAFGPGTDLAWKVGREQLQAKNAELRAALHELRGILPAVGPDYTAAGVGYDIQAQVIEQAERALKSDPSRASGSSDGSALGGVLQAALESLAADVRRWNMQDPMPDMSGKHKGWRYPQLEVYVERALASDPSSASGQDGSADPSTPGAGCGVCPECAASDSDPERCTAGIGKERGDAS